MRTAVVAAGGLLLALVLVLLLAWRDGAEAPRRAAGRQAPQPSREAAAGGDGPRGPGPSEPEDVAAPAGPVAPAGTRAAAGPFDAAGVLVDEGGRPLPRRRVVATPVGGEGGGGVLEARTGDDGRLRLRVTDGVVYAFALPDDAALGLLGTERRPERGVPFRLVAVRGATITGRALDAAGEPLPGVAVRATGHGVERTAGPDREGRFVLSGLRAGRDYVVVAQRHGWLGDRRDAVPAGTTGLELRLAKGRTLDGVLRDLAGEPVGPGTLLLDGPVRYEIPVGAGGRCVWRGVWAAEYRARYRAEGAERALDLGILRVPADPGVPFDFPLRVPGR